MNETGAELPQGAVSMRTAKILRATLFGGFGLVVLLMIAVGRHEDRTAEAERVAAAAAAEAAASAAEVERAARLQAALQALSEPEGAKRQAFRSQLIGQYRQLGLIGDITQRPHGLDLWVKPGFYGLSFKDKQAVVGVVFAAFHAADPDLSVLLLIDDRNGKAAGTFTPGLGLDLD